MADVHSSHPELALLQSFSLGKLEDDAASAAVAAHIETCDDCRLLFANIPEDTLAYEASPAGQPEGDATVASPLPEPSVFPADDDLPDCLEYFRIERVLGRGGMGMVYLAQDTRLGRQVALKTLKPELARRAEARQRFLREARAATALEHDHVVPIYYVGEADGIPFLAMPLLKGQTLDDHLKLAGGKLPVPTCIGIARQAAAGLAAAHERGLIHRDIKPSNLWLEATGGQANSSSSIGDFRVKILDFGLAKTPDADEPLTQSGSIMGTPSYMAPEQARGREVDARADLFSLGCVLYEMVTGRPFTGPDTMAILSSLALDTPPNPHTLVPECPPELSHLIMGLLEKDPAHRIPSAENVAQCLSNSTPGLDGRSRTAFTPAKGPWSMPDDSDPTAISPVGHAPSESLVKPNRNRFGTRPFVALFLLLVFLGGSSFAGYKLFFQTKDGTLIVEVADQETETRFKKGELHILDAAGFVKYRLRPTEKRTEAAPGDYQVRVIGADGLELDTQVFAMKKGGKVVVRVTARPPASAAKKNPALPDGIEWALEFDGRSSYVDLPLGYDGSHPLTIEAAVTVDPNGLDITGLVTNLAMPSRGNGGASLHLLPRGNGWQFIQHRQGKEVRAAGGPAIQPGRRTRLAGVWDGKICRLFVDGKLVALSDATHEMNSIDNPARFLLGCERLDGGTGWHFRGLIDEVRISGVARYDRDYAPSPRLDVDKHSLALYRFEEGRGDTLKDSSGNMHHGRIVGAKWVKMKGM